MPYCDLDPGVLLVFLKNLINMSIIVSELQPPQVDTKPLCYIRLSMEDEDVSLNQKEESNSVSSQRELLEAFIGNHSGLRIRRYRNTVMMDLPEQNLKDRAI